MAHKRSGGTPRRGQLTEAERTRFAHVETHSTPHGEWVGKDGKPIFFDGYDCSAYVTGKAKQSPRQHMHYINGLTYLGLCVEQWKYLSMDPGEAYDMVFNGAAPRAAGILATSPGRYAGEDNGWAVALCAPFISEIIESFNKYPNIPTILGGGASIGADLPAFTLPILVAPEKS